MKTLKIKNVNFYNNAAAMLNVNLSNGKTMCAKVLDTDKIKYLKKEVSVNELADKYFKYDGENFVKTNPIK